ncbi:wsv116 [White spot syndrome virus]|uniref:Wsv116 n=4 Tax=White spot syndrome virus TaxID=342409 RepID=Q8VB71_WSSVS|nr:wsv116 [Shrimp white spot syndrome virus]AFX59493.1 wsv116 [White spot syndrome virus]AAL33120.1 wsv116 [Shrimp white spot syndrome virus]AAL89040.1 WSSV172 [Shrimp white spot syndrome virus]AWQ60304.1 wsv116 [Shrimp white spot syndrome virus]AWQ60719.1 wsv116 [Shrimp white spot syndrome virus]
MTSLNIWSTPIIRGILSSHSYPSENSLPSKMSKNCLTTFTTRFLTKTLAFSSSFLVEEILESISFHIEEEEPLLIDELISGECKMSTKGAGCFGSSVIFSLANKSASSSVTVSGDHLLLLCCSPLLMAVSFLLAEAPLEKTDLFMAKVTPINLRELEKCLAYSGLFLLILIIFFNNNRLD